MEDEIFKYALENAVKHKGTAQRGAVIGKLIASDPSTKSRLKDMQKDIDEALKKANSMAPKEQLEMLQEIAPELLQKKEHAHDMFAFLNIREGDQVVTAFPPGPEKYPHIGHAKALLVNYLLAKKYNGRFILRFEDTNPALVKDEFYDIMKKDFEWLGAKWDELIHASDHMDIFYSHAQKLVEEGQAYVCMCTSEQVKESRMKSAACACRKRPVAENLALWCQYKVMDEGSAIVRLKIDLEHKNSTMRDPTIFRIIDMPHARQGRKYRVWPNYDFQNAIMDGESGVTHRIRSKEFEMRNELQRYIQNLLGYKETNIYEFARFNLEGVVSSGRKIREMIDKGQLIGWDDPSLTTLAALRRRGFLPEAIKNFVVSTGISKAESTLTWDDLCVHNRRLLDAACNRYFFISEPVKVGIAGAPEVRAEHKLHPDHPKRGKRILASHGEFYMEKKDRESLEEGKLYRFMDCLNFTVEHGELKFDSLEYEKYKRQGKKIMHYLPSDTGLVNVEVLMPDKSMVKGLAEPMAADTAEGDIVQFERFGFCRLDDKKNTLGFWYTHK